MQKKVYLSKNNFNDDENASLRELIHSIQDWTHYFSHKWRLILLSGVFGGALGLVYAILKTPVYTATTSFVLEEGNKGGGLRSYAGLASTFGVDLGGGGGGLFEGENILELYRSRNMITQTLLTEGEFGGKKQLLIDRYIQFNELKEKWDKKPTLRNIKFIPNNIYSTPQLQLLHDSIIGTVVNTIDKSYLNALKKDKKLNILYVTVTSPDELFSMTFNQKLVENVNNFYLDTKTKKSLENVAILQAKTDSVRTIMTGAINKAVVIADATPNQNPTRMAQRIAPIQNAKLNGEIHQQVLGTLIQNLELAKISLLRETPLIQIVDFPVLPLTKEKTSKAKSIILGGITIGLLFLFFLAIRRIIRIALASSPLVKTNKLADEPIN
ncbi:exopolysaccharide biosynthesis protein [Dyadobacter sp. 3J3]|uniref:exopolysaccharide biosynthesis protein n=1 Tax=Dyadobacter sp. 3J3 TaxID=2606600 RepID=UPI00190F9A1B|nr:exopolysaccharide biosynthesis protein [Dyadobacter sp. 3J3]